jgi:hypothetical protein
MRKTYLIVAAVAAFIPSIAGAQTILNTVVEDFEDGNAASRWDFLARESNSAVDPATATADGTVDFNSTISSNQWRVSVGDPLSNVVPGALNGSKAVRIGVNDDNVNRLAKAAITPKSNFVGQNYRMTLDTYMSFSDITNVVEFGSSEFAQYGLNTNPTTAAPTQVTGPTLASLTGSPGAAVNAQTGYSFHFANEGGYGGDNRIYTAEANDDGPRYWKRNAAWSGGYDELFPNAAGEYNNTRVRPEEDNNSIHFAAFPDANPVLNGVPGLRWVTTKVEQRGRIVNFWMNGQIFNTLFTVAPREGRVSVGAYDGAASTPPVSERPLSYFLFDNIAVSNLSAAPSNTINASDTFFVMNSGATVTANGAAAATGLTFDVASTTLAGTGDLVMGGEGHAAILADAGNHVIDKPVVFTSNTSISVDEGDTLTINDTSWGTNNKDLHKIGRGLLTLENVRARSLTISSGPVKLKAGGSYVNNLLYGYGPTATLGDATLLDVGKSLVAVDYLSGPLASGTTTLSPIQAIADRLNTGFGGGAWNGPGINSSDIVAAGSNFAIRLSEASALGYTAGSAWIDGLTIDDTTVIFGFTFSADVNLDQKVDFTDLLVLAQNYDATGLDPISGWNRGDTDLSTVVDFTDLLALAQQYGGTISLRGNIVFDPAVQASFEADWAYALSIVPEPTLLAATVVGAGLTLRRRRK